jgi:hypothetical protein
MSFKKFSLRFVDSLNFLLCPLADLPKTYSFNTIKGYFPHEFNTRDNQDYIGEIPAIKFFGPQYMSSNM